MAKKKNWDILQGRNRKDLVQNRDVYEDQQLERSKITEKQSPLGRTIVAWVLTAFVAIAIWIFISLVASFINLFIDMGKTGAVGKFHISFGFTFVKLLLTMMSSLLFFSIIYKMLMRNLVIQNLMSDTTDINQYQNDQHIALPEEVMKTFDFFPDIGAHSSVSVSSMISHIAITNKGLNPVDVSVRAKENIYDEDGELEYIKGEVLLDDNGKPIMTSKDMIDTKLMDELFTVSGVLDDKDVRKYYDTRKIPYNQGNADREKLKGYDTLADLINGDWELPYYETQRPAGVYIVDTAPVNTIKKHMTY